MKTWTKEEIKDLLLKHDKMVCLSLRELYKCQTEDEKLDGETSHQNGMGFNGVDAPILSSFAVFYLERGYLSPKQILIARKKLIKYCGQLTRLANNQSA